jgi:hypothetical protein
MSSSQARLKHMCFKFLLLCLRYTASNGPARASTLSLCPFQLRFVKRSRLQAASSVLLFSCRAWLQKWSHVVFARAVQLNAAIADEAKFFAQLQKENLSDGLATLRDVLRVLSAERSPQACVRLALHEFLDQYRNRIKDLIHAFPEDARNSQRQEDGTELDLGPFWTGKKRSVGKTENSLLI